MLMNESVELNDLLEVLKSLFEDTKIRLNFMENLYEKYRNNNEMKRILNSIYEYGHSLGDEDDNFNPFRSCFAPLHCFLPFMNKSSLNQSLLHNGNGIQLNLEFPFKN
ncbi:unnamed protein product [Rhizophagus irregularis]|jgi:hypothetical protein|uniref:Uncharacterized protein n=1 Tax=Rhizophagus irregularis TaxID=588596 RepID=A0A2I1GUJ8_9GLOM|nr:hypothetical protein RhiirA4_466558 [Rhizophagus irregularis]CAB4425599.1 unnamed protein product [Rhizophagus irregularis]CAB4425780.1 unnamed protein product [Rhizophagus irregularis]